MAKVSLDQIVAQTKIDPRGYQSRITEKAVGYYEAGSPSVLIESPTGSGKTVMSMLIAKYMQENYGLKVGFIAMRRNLLRQTARENKEKGFNIDMVFISMFETFGPNRPAPEVDLLIVDEAHHDSCATMATIHSVLKPKFILGLTATPFRADKVGLAFEKVIKDASIHRLIQDGFLAPYHYYTIKEWTPALIAEIYLERPDHWGKSVVFFHKSEDCEELATLLRDGGVNVEVVTAKTNKTAQLDAFEQGEVDVLINMMILTEGFDCPALKTAFVRPSVKGVTVQMGGRVLRPHKDTPIKQIVQCKKTKWPFQKIAKFKEGWTYKNGEWLGLKGSEQVDKTIKKTRRRYFEVRITFDKNKYDMGFGKNIAIDKDGDLKVTDRKSAAEGRALRRARRAARRS